MKLPAWLRPRHWRTVPVSAAPYSDAAPAWGTIARNAPSFLELAEPRDQSLFGQSLAALNDQMHDVINRNADGINRAAMQLRRETDLLLSLGISDPLAARAGSYAQVALELANAGRGVNLQSRPHDLQPSRRAELVAQAIALMARADGFMRQAKAANQANIEAALALQERRMRNQRAALLLTHASKAL